MRARSMATLISTGWKEEVRRQRVAAAEQRALAPAFEHKEMEKALALQGQKCQQRCQSPKCRRGFGKADRGQRP